MPIRKHCECNRPWHIGEVLAAADLLQEAIPAAVDKNDLLAQLQMHKPVVIVVIVVMWRNGVAGHLLVISEVTADEQLVIWDSRETGFSMVSFEALKIGYPASTSWVNTFYTG